MQKHHIDTSVRALMWSFGSPSIVTAPSDPRWQDNHWFSFRALELAGLLEQPVWAPRLESYLDDEKDHRLGARFERLVEFGLEHLPDFECVQRRLQVQKEGRTRGEFDFIVRNTARYELEHWEVACKFYLGVPVNGELQWVGPGKRDSLVRKLGHLTRKQLELSNRPETVETCASLGKPLSRVRAIVKGRLFYPLAHETLRDSSFTFDAPRGDIQLNPSAPVGFWCDIDQLQAARPESLYELTKTQWLDPEAKGEQVTVDQLAMRVGEGPQCLSVVTGDGHVQRWFVVSSGWFDDLDVKAIS